MENLEYASEFARFEAMADALGADATERQADNLVSYIIDNLPRWSWRWAGEYACCVPGVYTEISMRLGECGEY